MKTYEEQGGPAFPSQPCNAQGLPVCEAQIGMTLRDYFAAQAMNGYLAYWPEGGGVIASKAYELADAMLKERDK